MKIVTKHPDGVFSWVELATTDIEGANAFYSGLFGWEVDSIPVSDDYSYTQYRLNGYAVAGGGPLSAEEAAQGIPSHWTSYVNHSDVDAVAARAAEAGGAVLAEPFDVTDQGRMAIIQDPTGGVFGVWQPNKHGGAQIVNQPNSLVWNELQTADTARAAEFYNKVFGWKKAVTETDYAYMTRDNRIQCGFITLDPAWGYVPPNWLVYYLVDDVDAKASRVVELGGAILSGPSDIAGLGRMAVAHDPQGATFALIKYIASPDEPLGLE